MNESEEDVSGDKTEQMILVNILVSLWTIGLGGRCVVWAAARDGGIKDVDKGRDSEVTCTFGGKDDGKEGKDEDGYDSAWGENVADGTDELLLGGEDSAKFNDAGSNGFANGYNIDNPTLILDKKNCRLTFQIFYFLILLSEETPYKKNHFE